jgi:cell division protein FtsA
MPDDYILGLDLGTKKVAALLGQSYNGQVTLCGIGLAPSEGIRRGEVIDMERAAAAISSAIANLNVPTSAPSGIASGNNNKNRTPLAKAPQRVWVGITGDHIRCFNPRAEITLPRPNRPVTPRDVEEALRQAVTSVALPPGHEVIHVIARSFALDGADSPQAGHDASSPRAAGTYNIANPVGMPATKLSVQAHVVAASAAALGNLERCVEQAGLTVEGVVLEPIASADAVLSDAERDLGVAILDIGAGTTDIAIFTDGGISYTGVIPLGGSHFTRDLAVGLEIDLEDAEALKLASGCALIDAVGRDEKVTIKPLSADEPRQIPRTLVAEILQPRAMELLSLCKEKIMQAGYYHRLAVGVVLSGGGALLSELIPLATQVLGMPVRLGRPIAKGPATVKDPSFSTGVGLLLYGSHEQLRPPPGGWPPIKQSITARLAAWWKHLFGP